MPASFSSITLTGGAATRTITDGNNYKLKSNGYKPLTPQPIDAGLTALTAYRMIVGERMDFNITGSSKLDAKAGIEEDFDQARRWKNGESVDPIILSVQAQGSNLNPLKTVVHGGDLLLPSNFLDMLMVDEIPDCAIDYERLPLFLGDEETPSASSSVANPGIMSVTFTGDPLIASPVELLLDGFTLSLLADNYLLISASASNFSIVEAESASDGTTAGAWSTPTDAGKNPSGGNIGRWAAGDTNWQKVSFTGLAMSGKTLAVYGAVRQNNSGSVWEIKADSQSLAAILANGETRPKIIDYNGGEPQIIPFGLITSARSYHDVVNIYFRVDDATGSPTIDFDYFVFQIMDSETDQVIRSYGDPNGLSGNIDLTYDHRLLEKPEPAVILSDGTNEAFAPYDTPPIVYSRGTNLSAIWLSTYSTQWVHTDTALSSPSSLNITATRRIAYLSPE